MSCHEIYGMVMVKHSALQWCMITFMVGLSTHASIQPNTPWWTELAIVLAVLQVTDLQESVERPVDWQVCEVPAGGVPQATTAEQCLTLVVICTPAWAAHGHIENASSSYHLKHGFRADTRDTPQHCATAIYSARIPSNAPVK